MHNTSETNADRMVFTNLIDIYMLNIPFFFLTPKLDRIVSFLNR